MIKKRLPGICLDWAGWWALCNPNYVRADEQATQVITEAILCEQLPVSFGALTVSLYLLFMFWQDDFLLIHYDKGPCRNKLGHSRASVIWHRTQVRIRLGDTLSPSSAACGRPRARSPLSASLTLRSLMVHYYVDGTVEEQLKHKRWQVAGGLRRAAST